MNLKTILLLALLLSLQAFCGEKSVFVLNSTDIHSKLDDSADEFGRTSNLLRLSSLIRDRKAALGGAENLILIDCGDILQGSFQAMLSEGETGIIFLRHNAYDAWIPGNHDFDFGYARFKKLAGEIPLVAALAANLESKASPPWKIFRKNGLNIAVIGATLPYLESFSLQARQIKTLSLDEKLDATIPEIMRQSPNTIIFAIHQGAYSPKERGGYNLAKIATRFPQINLILGGHSHEDNPGQKIGPSTWFVQAGYHARTLAEIEMIFDEKSRKLLDIRARLIDVTKKNKKDRELENLLSEIISNAEKSAGKIIGESASRIPSVEEGVIACEIRELLSAAMCAAAQCEIAFSGYGTRHANFEGKIRKEQIFNLLPYQDTVCVLALTPEQFREILEEQTGKFHSRHFQMPWGVFCELDENNKALSIRLPDGKKWEHGKRRVAFSSFALAGAGGRFPILANFAKKPECELRDTGVKIRDATISFIEKNSPLQLAPKEWINKNFPPRNAPHQAN